MRRVGPLWIVALVLVAALPLFAAEPDPHEGIWLKNKALRRLLKRQSATNEQILEALVALEREYVALPPDAEVQDEAARKKLDKLKEEIEKNWIRALTVSKIPPRMEVNLRTAVQIRATRAIAISRRGIDARYRRALERRVLDNKKYVCAPALYQAAFSALVALDQPRLVEWFLDHGIKSQVDPDHKQRTLAALDALRSMRNVPGAERREVVRKIVALFQSYAFHWLNEYDAVAGFRTVKKVYAKVAGVATPYWMDIRPTILETLRHFSLDPRTGLPPMDKQTGRELEALPRYLNWFATNQRVSMPPWRDPTTGEGPVEPKRAQGRYVRPAIPLLFHRYGIPWESWWAVARDPQRPRTRESSAPDASDSDVFRVALRDRLPSRLKEYLQDEAPQVRAAAAVALAQVGKADVIEPLLALVESDARAVVREAAMLGLMLRHPAEHVAWFKARVLDVEEDPRVRAYATLALGWLKASPFLWTLVRDTDRKALGGEAPYADIRACAVFALGLAGEPDASEPLAKLLASQHECPAVLSAVGAALARLGQDNVVPALLRLLADRRKIETRHVAQVSAAQALGALVGSQDRAAIRTLRQRLERSREQFGGVRSEIAIALGRIGGTHAMQCLEDEYERCLKSTTRVAERGFFLLGFGLTSAASGRHRVRTQLSSLKHDKDLGAAAAAVTLGDDRLGVTRVAGWIDTAGPNFTPPGIECVGRLGSLPAVDDVRDVIQRRHDPRVKRAAAMALARLAGPAALPDVRTLWERSHTPASYDALAWAAYHMPSSEVEAWLHTVARQFERRPHERAFAILALARVAGGDVVRRARAFTEFYNPYGEAVTLTGLALRREAAFLH